MKSVRRKLTLLASLSLLVGLAACGGDDSGSSGSATTAGAAPTTGGGTSPTTGGGSDTTLVGGADSTTASSLTPTSGGTLTHLRYSEQPSNDPAKLLYSNGESNLLNYPAVFDQLLYQDPETAEVTYRLATSLSSDDGINWELKLRPGVKFSDGTVFDAEAVKFNWERIADPATASTQAAGMAGVDSVEVVDATTLHVTLKEKNTLFPSTVARSLNFIGSPTAIAADPVKFGEEPVGAGPFLLTNWVKGDRMEFSRNPDYWDAPRPYLDKLVLRMIPDDEARFNTLVTGDGQIAENPLNPTYDARAEDEGFTVINRNPSGGLVLFLNNSVAPFDDVRVRKAVQLAIDPEAVNEALFQGEGKSAATIFKDGTPFYEPDITFAEYDPAAAQALFDEVVAEKGPISFSIVGSPATAKTSEYVQNVLGQFEGVNVEVETLPSSESSQRIVTGNMQVGSGGLQISAGGDELATFFGTGSPQNYSRYSNPDVDAALAQARSVFDIEDRAASYATVQEHLVEDVPVIFLMRQGRSTYYEADSVHGLSYNSGGINWADVWLSK